MNKPIGLVVACALGLFACNVEHYEDCHRDDSFDDFEEGPSKPSGGAKASGGSDGSGASASRGGAGSASSDPEGEAGAPTPPEPPRTPCEKERDCTPGFNCNHDVNQCEPAAEETCSELDLEADCVTRADCVPVYGGTNCSCGQDCECEGGEPGCICESFEFFVCRAAE